MQLFHIYEKCIEPYKFSHAGQNNEYTIEEIGYTRELGYKLAYYVYKVNPTINNYVLRQNLLWETIGTQIKTNICFQSLELHCKYTLVKIAAPYIP